ncbi:hypothetical protein TDB9533_03100 [Thalassocella blandensis]|nr:hypothetical protein TDB9533_03100 [Thalassocella blandensis]
MYCNVKTLFSLALLLACAHATAWQNGEAFVPNNTNWKPLYNMVDLELQADLEKKLNSNPQWRQLIAKKRLAVGVVDMSGKQPKFARVNGNIMMYAASMPKIAILLTAYAAFEDGSLEETESIHQDLSDMIRVSSNDAATRVIDAVGLPKIQEVLTDPRYGLYNEERGGGLWVGKRYAKTGSRLGDPLHNISHGATVTQTCRFYYMLAQGKLVSIERSGQMLADLADPKLHHKFVSQLDKLAPQAQVFRKSGTWKNSHSDSVMVWGNEWRNYILVAMVESPNGSKIIENIVPAVESVLQR